MHYKDRVSGLPLVRSCDCAEIQASELLALPLQMVSLDGILVVWLIMILSNGLQQDHGDCLSPTVTGS